MWVHTNSIYVFTRSFECVCVTRGPDEEVQASCSAGKLLWEVSASLWVLRHAHHCVLLSIQLVCLSQPVLAQTFHLNSHRNRINKSPAQTAVKGIVVWEVSSLRNTLNTDQSWILFNVIFLIMPCMNCDWHYKNTSESCIIALIALLLLMHWLKCVSFFVKILSIIKIFKRI